MTLAEPAFKIKIANLPLWVIHVHNNNMAQIKRQLASRLSQTPDFFSHTPVVLGLSAVANSQTKFDFTALTTLMWEHGMRLIGVQGGSTEHQAAATQAGLSLFPDAPLRNSPVFPDPTPAQPLPPLVIDKPVRAGQKIYAENTDLVVLAIVNAGAELIADGDIHVYAPLRGRAMAGAQGNQSARIFVQSLEAELLSIAGCFQMFEEGIPQDVRNHPVQVYLDEARLVIQSY
ncbi:MAG: septum site-determining protein MinC [Gallionella sp.]|nr:septum site-determining protein MinC [Gallionella sp.]